MEINHHDHLVGRAHRFVTKAGVSETEDFIVRLKSGVSDSWIKKFVYELCEDIIGYPTPKVALGVMTDEQRGHLINISLHNDEELGFVLAFISNNPGSEQANKTIEIMDGKEVNVGEAQGS